LRSSIDVGGYVRILLFRIWSRADEIIPPIGIGYLMQSVRQISEVELLDGLKDRLGPWDFARAASSGKYDLVGITGFSKDGQAIKRHLSALRAITLQAKILVGGILVTASPKNTYEYLKDTADYFLAGEAEESLPILVKAIQNGGPLPKIPGLAIPDSAGLEWPPPKRPGDLDSLQVAWDLLKPESYPQAPHGAFSAQFPCAPIITSRGCSIWCKFCSVPAITGRRIRRRSVANVVGEIRLLHERHGINEIHIEDDNFTENEEYVLQFGEQLLQLPYSLTWTCPNGVRLDTLTPPVLDVMKRSNCSFVSVGIESADDRMLAKMHKGFNTAKVRSKIKEIAKTGIRVGGFFIVGLPGETWRSIEDTAAFSRSLPLTRASFSYYQPFPGSPLRAELEKSGGIGPIDFDREILELHEVGYVPKGMTALELIWLRRKSFLCFYLRPAPIIRLVASITSFAHFRFVVRRILRWLL